MKVYAVEYTDTTDSDSGLYQKVSTVSSICMSKKAAWKRVEEIFDSWMGLLCRVTTRFDYRIISIDINPGLRDRRDRVRITFTKGLDMRIITIRIKQLELEK